MQRPAFYFLALIRIECLWGSEIFRIETTSVEFPAGASRAPLHGEPVAMPITARQEYVPDRRARPHSRPAGRRSEQDGPANRLRRAATLAGLACRAGAARAGLPVTQALKASSRTVIEADCSIRYRAFLREAVLKQALERDDLGFEPGDKILVMR